MNQKKQLYNYITEVRREKEFETVGKRWDFLGRKWRLR